MGKVPKILLAVPTRDAAVVSEFAQALMFCAGRPWFYGSLWVENDSDIVRGRGRVFSEFLATDADAVLMLDDDIVWRPEDVDRLLEVPGGNVVVGGVYVKRRPEGGLVFLGPLGEMCPGVSEAVSVRGVGGGMMLVWRDALVEACAFGDVEWYGARCARWPGVCRQMVVDGDYLSEDYAFCERVRRVGGRVYLHRGVRLGHVGRFVYRV